MTWHGAAGVGAALALAACYRPSAREVVAPDGQAAFVVECRQPADCMELAGEKCPGGYFAMDQDQSTESGAVYSAGGGTGFGSAYSRTTRAVMIRCRAEKPKPAEPKTPERCGYTCAPQPRECPWLDENGCYKPGYEVPSK